MEKLLANIPPECHAGILAERSPLTAALMVKDACWVGDRTNCKLRLERSEIEHIALAIYRTKGGQDEARLKQLLQGGKK